MKKRITSIALVIVMAASIFAGYGIVNPNQSKANAAVYDNVNKELTHSISYSNFKSKKQNGKWRTYIKTVYSWKWNKKSGPNCAWTDTVACTTSTSFIVNGEANAICYINYKNIATGKTKTKVKKCSVKDGGRRVYCKFPIRMNGSSQLNNGDLWRAVSGRIEVGWVKDKTTNTVGLTGNYGHAKSTVTPSVSFGSSGSISFTPKSKVQYKSSAYKVAKK